MCGEIMWCSSGVHSVGVGSVGVGSAGVGSVGVGSAGVGSVGVGSVVQLEGPPSLSSRGQHFRDGRGTPHTEE